jgi:hypothetical protein
MSGTSFEEVRGTWPFLGVPKGDIVPNCDDYLDSLLSFLEGDIENHEPSQESIEKLPLKEQHKSKNIKLKAEHLDLQCEWRDCDYHTGNLDHFVRHVSLHLPHLEVKINKDQEGTFCFVQSYASSYQLLFIFKIFQKYLVL